MYTITNFSACKLSSFLSTVSQKVRVLTSVPAYFEWYYNRTFSSLNFLN